MEGPTPVSALIHAATMVAAGVYMLCRGIHHPSVTNRASGHCLDRQVYLLMAALIAVQQDDIKRILAYSTLSQLGYMVMAVGLASNDAGCSSDHSCIFQGAAVPRRRLGHRNAASRAEHLENGRAAQKMPITF